jgi:5-methylcytosine-specific restriction protein A
VSTSRLPRGGGHVRPSQLPKGSHGRALCRQCATEVPSSRRTFCSDECVDEWKAAHMWPADVRRLLEKRDHGVCAICGLDCIRTVNRMRSILTKLRGPGVDLFAASWAYRYSAEASEQAMQHPLVREFCELAKRAGVKSSHRFSTVWDADHIKPVCEGGGECDLSNYRTLCRGCHHKESATLAKRRSKARKA